MDTNGSTLVCCWASQVKNKKAQKMSKYSLVVIAFDTKLAHTDAQYNSDYQKLI